MTSPGGLLSAVCVAYALRPGPKHTDGTGIDKLPVTGPVEAGPLGLAGDRIGDLASHGGPEQAVYAYADEDADWWAERLQREVPPGLFGENLRTARVDVNGAEIGERWRIGGADGVGGVLVQVTAPRIPCVTFADRMGEPHWVKRFAQGRRPGAYLAVLEGGPLAAGDPITVVHRPGHGVTVADIFPGLPADMARHLLDANADPDVPFTLLPKMLDWCLNQTNLSPS